MAILKCPACDASEELLRQQSSEQILCLECREVFRGRLPGPDDGDDDGDDGEDLGDDDDDDDDDDTDLGFDDDDDVEKGVATATCPECEESSLFRLALSKYGPALLCVRCGAMVCPACAQTIGDAKRTGGGGDDDDDDNDDDDNDDNDDDDDDEKARLDS